MEEDIYIRYFKHHYSLYGTVNNIGDNDTVEFDSQTLKIGWFKREIRSKHSNYVQGINKKASFSERSIKRYAALDELGFEWEPQKKKSQELLQTDLYIKYLRERFKENGTINDILTSDQVEYEGKILKIGLFFKSIRNAHHYYEMGISKDQSFTELSIMRYKALDEMDFIWSLRNNQIANLLEYDPYISYLKQHFRQRGTINDIVTTTIIEYNGERLNFDSFLDSVEEFKSHYNLGDREYADTTITVFKRRLETLETLGFKWEGYERRATRKKDSDPYIDFLKEYYAKHGTINNIPTSVTVEFNGEELKIGDFLRSIRYNHKFYISGQKRAGAHTATALSRYKILDELGFNWEVDRTLDSTKIADENGLVKVTVKTYLTKFNGDVDKTVKIIRLMKERREEQAKGRKEQYNLSNILKEFNIDMDSLANYLDRPRLKTGKPKQKTLMYSDDMSLWEFCINNGYNYDAIFRAVKMKMNNLCDEDFESLINRVVCDYVSSNTHEPSTWVYSKYGGEVLVKHLLLYMGFDSKVILRDMQKNVINLDQAVERACFRQESRQNFDYLEGIYHDFMCFYRNVLNDEQSDEATASESLLNYADNIIKEYHLTKEEFTVIRQAFSRYTEAAYKYQLFDVGFEKDENKRIKKIISYHFDEETIEEAFFIPLKFDKRVLIGRDSQLYQRRVLLKNLTVSWNSLNDMERKDKINTYGISSDELVYISSTREAIDKAKILLKK